MNIEEFYNDIWIIVIMLVISTSITLFWRICIYIRGGIFRPVGRLLDLWKYEGSLGKANIRLRVLRFIAMPLGGCVYCSSFHFAYETFYVMRWLFGINIGSEFLFVMLPLSSLFIMIGCKVLIHNNSDLCQDDVEPQKTFNNLYQSDNVYYDEYIIWTKPIVRSNKSKYL